MKLTFIGHQSWHVRSGQSSILIDPILEQAFGHTPELPFAVWPPRDVDTRAMPSPQAVILSHEHLDHFHIPSLGRLDRSVPVYTGDITPLAVVQAIEALGFTVHRVRPTEKVSLPGLEVTFYPAGPQTISWEKRVFQLAISEPDQPDNDVFIPVDALMSTEYLTEIAQGHRNPPRAVIIANNGQLVPKGALGAYTNLLPTGNNGRTKDLQLLDVITELAEARQVEGLGSFKEIIICGGGFMGPRSPHGPFLFSDHHWLAYLANELQSGHQIYGPWPGETLTVEQGREISCEQSQWIILDKDQRQLGEDRLHEYLGKPQKQKIVQVLPGFGSRDERMTALGEVEAVLPSLARELFHTSVGQLASSIHSYLRGPLDSRRALLVFLDDSSAITYQYAWDIARMEFVPQEPVSDADALRSYPFGLKLYLRDFVGVLRGEQQIWDLAGTAMQSWYVGDSYATLITAFYELYGEQARPDLAARVYQRALRRYLEHETANTAQNVGLSAVELHGPDIPAAVGGYPLERSCRGFAYPIRAECGGTRTREPGKSLRLQ